MTIFIFKEPITNYLVSNNNLKLVGVLYGKNTLYDVVARMLTSITSIKPSRTYKFNFRGVIYCYQITFISINL